MEGNKLTLGRQRQRGLQQREPRSPHALLSRRKTCQVRTKLTSARGSRHPTENCGGHHWGTELALERLAECRSMLRTVLEAS